MNEDHNLAFGDEIFNSPFDSILAGFILVYGNRNKAVAAAPSPWAATPLWIWKPHSFSTFMNASSQAYFWDFLETENCGSFSWLSLLIFDAEKFCLFEKQLESMEERLTKGMPEISPVLVTCKEIGLMV